MLYLEILLGLCRQKKTILLAAVVSLEKTHCTSMKDMFMPSLPQPSQALQQQGVKTTGERCH